MTPSAPRKDGKGYEKIIYYRGIELKKKYNFSIFVSHPVYRFYKKDNVEFINGIKVLHVYPNFLDLFLSIIKIILGHSVLTSIYNNSRLRSILSEIDEGIYFNTSRCINSMQAIKCPIVVDFVDSMHLNFSRRVLTEKNFFYKLFWKYEANKIKIHEQRVAAQANLCVCVSSIDAAVISDRFIQVLPLGVEIKYGGLKQDKRKVMGGGFSIVFSGNLNYQPNISAIVWFLDNCWLEILTVFPQASLSIVGRHCSQELFSYASNIKQVSIVGEVEDMMTTLSTFDISIAPMVSGSGMQFKILEAMGMGVPVIATKIGLGDIKAEDMKHLMVREGNQDFIEGVCALLRDSKLRRNLGSNGYEFVKTHHSWEEHNKNFMNLLENILQN